MTAYFSDFLQLVIESEFFEGSTGIVSDEFPKPGAASSNLAGGTIFSRGYEVHNTPLYFHRYTFCRAINSTVLRRGTGAWLLPRQS